MVVHTEELLIGSNYCGVLLFGGTDAPATIVNVESIGGSLSGLAASVTEVFVNASLGITGDRIYVNF